MIPTPRPTLHLLAAAALVLCTVAVYFSATHGGLLYQVDQALLERSHNDRSDALAQWVTHFTNIGTTAGTAPIATALTLLLAWRRRSWWPVFIVATSAACSVLTTTLVKVWLGRPRPEHVFAVAPFEYAPSFPSGHTLNAVVVFGIIAILYRSTFGHILAVLYILAMGASRIWLGHHWFSDVLAGWFLGIAWLLVLTTCFHWLYTTRHPGGVVRTVPARVLE